MREEQTAVLAAGFPEALSNDCLIMDKELCKQRGTREYAQRRAYSTLRSVECKNLKTIVRANVCVTLDFLHLYR